MIKRGFKIALRSKSKRYIVFGIAKIFDQSTTIGLNVGSIYVVPHPTMEKRPPKSAVPTIPIKKAPFTFLIIKIDVKINPNMNSPNWRFTGPNSRIVANPVTTIPEPENPITTKKIPIPAANPYLNDLGIAFNSPLLTGVKDIMVNIAPAIIMAPITSGHVTPLPKYTVNAT